MADKRIPSVVEPLVDATGRPTRAWREYLAVIETLQDTIAALEARIEALENP